jgi:Na+-driven multidrug efflux pump
LFINILNVFGNYSLIFGHFGFPALGVHGAAISTSVCRGVAMTLLFIVLFKRLIKRLPLDYFRPFPFAKLKASLKIGIPAASEQISYDASQVMIVYFVNILGTEALAARVYVVNIVIVTYLFSLSLAQSAGICAGNLLGMGKKKATYLLTMYALRRSLIVTGCASLLILLFSRSLLSQFTQNETIIVLGIGALAVDLILEQGRAAVLLFIMTLRSAGDVIFPVIIGLFSMWFFAVFCGYTFGILFGWGLAGMWIGFALDECSRGTLLYYRWKSQKWKKRTLIRSNVKID